MPVMIAAKVMSEMIYRIEAWVLAGLLFVALTLVWAGGRWWGRNHASSAAVAGNKVDDASLALMGLLLGFTFAMAIQKHDNRRDKVVEDSNAIGDFYTTAGLVREPLRGELRGATRDYARFRLELAQSPWLLDDARVDESVAKINAMQGRIGELVGRAVNGGTPVAVPLVNTLNGMSSSYAARLASVRDRLPGAIVALLFLAALMSVAVLGRSQGIEGRRAPLSTLFFIVLISFTFYVTLDLNQPGRGLIRVSQEPMERLVDSMD
jgi:hypothetical protein